MLWLVVLLDVVIVQWTGLLVVVVFVLLFWTYYFVCGCCEGVCGLFVHGWTPLNLFDIFLISCHFPHITVAVCFFIGSCRKTCIKYFCIFFSIFDPVNILKKSNKYFIEIYGSSTLTTSSTMESHALLENSCTISKVKKVYALYD